MWRCRVGKRSDNQVGEGGKTRTHWIRNYGDWEGRKNQAGKIEDTWKGHDRRELNVETSKRVFR